MAVDPFVDDTVGLKALAEHPEDCLRRAPVAVSEGERVLGYLINPPYFEALMALATACEKQCTVEGQFHLSEDKLHAIGRDSARLLSEASEEEMAMFSTFHKSGSDGTGDD